MLNVHLYFLKVFGCQILEGNIRIDTAPFADAILKGQPHPNVYLAFGPAPSGLPLRISGSSDVDVAMLDGLCAFATWFYHVGNLWVNVMYAIDGERRAWATELRQAGRDRAAEIVDGPRQDDT